MQVHRSCQYPILFQHPMTYVSTLPISLHCTLVRFNVFGYPTIFQLRLSRYTTCECHFNYLGLIQLIQKRLSAEKCCQFVRVFFSLASVYESAWMKCKQAIAAAAALCFVNVNNFALFRAMNSSKSVREHFWEKKSYVESNIPHIKPAINGLDFGIQV